MNDNPHGSSDPVSPVPAVLPDAANLEWLRKHAKAPAGATEAREARLQTRRRAVVNRR